MANVTIKDLTPFDASAGDTLQSEDCVALYSQNKGTIKLSLGDMSSFFTSESSDASNPLFIVKAITSEQFILTRSSSTSTSTVNFTNGAFEMDNYTLCGVVGYNFTTGSGGTTSHITISRMYPTNANEIAMAVKNSNFDGQTGTSITASVTIFCLYIKNDMVSLNI